MPAIHSGMPTRSATIDWPSSAIRRSTNLPMFGCSSNWPAEASMLTPESVWPMRSRGVFTEGSSRAATAARRSDSVKVTVPLEASHSPVSTSVMFGIVVRPSASVSGMLQRYGLAPPPSVGEQLHGERHDHGRDLGEEQ